VGATTITVESDSPVWRGANFECSNLRRVNADCLVIQPNLSAYHLQLLCVAVGVIFLVWGNGPVWLGLLFLGFGLFGFVYELYFTPRICFDRRQGLMIPRSVGDGKARPLVDIVAVQLSAGLEWVDYDSPWGIPRRLVEKTYEPALST
jgi:hypothetical protein